MVYKEINGYAYQMDYGDISKVWFLTMARLEESKPLIEGRYKTKKEGLNAMKELIKQMNKTEKFKLPCGHNNASKINLYPFDEWFCLDCGLRTKTIIQEDLKIKTKTQNYQEGFNILMEYFDSLPDEEKPKIDKRLKKLNL